MMRRTTGGVAAVSLLVAALACASGMAKPDDTGAAPDTSSTQNPPGYRGMERDTTQAPTDSQPTPTDTFLQSQGTGQPQDTAGYSGLERPDTSGAAGADTSSMGGTDTTSTTGVDTSGMSGMSDTTSSDSTPQ